MNIKLDKIKKLALQFSLWQGLDNVSIVGIQYSFVVHTTVHLITHIEQNE
jgi:hypothetical protein